MLDSLPQDLADRWKRGDKVRALDYLKRQPELRKNLGIYKLLVQEELRQMNLAGLDLDTQQLVKDYPECQEIILGFDPQFETLVPTQRDAFETQLEHTKALDGIARTSRSGFPQIPGFEILSELGRGGMGVVYRALQISANRLVALKVVRNEVLETANTETRSNAVERFRTEAKAAASLQHDNIISVYEVGEVPSKDRRHAPLRYYAMRFVLGTSLYDILRQGPLENHRAARYIAQVARGLQAAHDQGILHRDMKPHNVMVETSSDRPLIADFGLAKFVHSDNSITYAGQIMGTPSYMSPEQAQDASLVKAAGDQYSLGATLYHLLTGHPPFAAPSVQETIRQILEKPVVRLRESNPAVDRDLETICMKAIEKEPAKRYASCHDLADDLQRYLDGMPIVARPVSSAERAWRWCRRNPVLSGMIAAVSLLALSTIGAIIVGYRQTATALAVSESRLDKALQVVDDLFTRVSEDELLNEPGMQKLRTELLEKALTHYEYFLSDRKKNSGNVDSKILEEIGKSNFRFGTVQKLTGKLDKAQEAFNEARAIQEGLLKQSPESIQRLEELTDTLNAIGTLASEQGDDATALDAFERSHDYRVQLVAKDPSELRYQRLACNTLMNIGLTKINADRIEQGLEDLHKAQDQRLALLGIFPEAEKLHRDIARGWYSLGKCTFQPEEPQEANEYFEKSVESFRKAIQLNQRSLSNQFDCSVALRLLGETYISLSEDQKAQRSFEEAHALAMKLADNNPEVVSYQTQLAHLDRSLGACYASQEQWDKSEQSWKQALEITRKYQSLSPDNELLLGDLVTCLSALGDLAQRKGDDQAARRLWQESIPGLRKLTASYPDDQELQEQLNKNIKWLESHKQ